MKRRFILFSDTFLWLKGDNGLLYNAHNGQQFHFRVSKEIRILCSHFLNMDNLYSYSYDIENETPAVRNFFNGIESRGLGRFVDSLSRMVILPPFLKIENDVNHWKNDMYSFPMLEYLRCVTIYLGGEFEDNDLYIQTEYPFNSQYRIGNGDIIQFVAKCLTIPVKEVNIVINDLFHTGTLQLLNYWVDMGDTKSLTLFVCSPNSIEEINMINKLLTMGYSIVVLFRWDSNICFADSLYVRDNVRWRFLVKREQDIIKTESIRNKIKASNYEIIPIADDNYKFFLSHVFLDSSDLLTTVITKRQIFIHQTLNINYFGKIIVMPDGRIYSNVMCKPIGKLTDSLHHIILEEFKHNYSWRLIRNSRDCKLCVYQWICPSPFIQEKMLNHNRACTLTEEDLQSFQSIRYQDKLT